MHSRQSRANRSQRAASAQRVRLKGRLALMAGIVAMAAFIAGGKGNGQETMPNPLQPRPVPMPERNRIPDVNDQMKFHEQNARNRNFEAANAERKRQIDDETGKLLILAKDLKSKMDKLGDEPMPPVLVKEASVIEILANDVKVKMKMTVGGG
jgi:hypothetical protein